MATLALNPIAALLMKAPAMDRGFHPVLDPKQDPLARTALPIPAHESSAPNRPLAAESANSFPHRPGTVQEATLLGKPVLANAMSTDPVRVAHAAEQAYLGALAARCVSGDHAAWELLVRREQRRIYGLCYRFTGSAPEAEDLTQEVFLKLYRNLQSFDPSRASFGVWLTTLTRNLLVDHFRRSRLERASESLDVPYSQDGEGESRAERLPDRRGDQEQHVAGLELRARVQSALARVTPELREAVILRDLHDMDYREIAAVLEIPQGTVKSRISRGRAELARLLGSMEGQVV